MTPASTVLRLSWARTADQRAAWRARGSAVPEEWATEWTGKGGCTRVGPTARVGTSVQHAPIEVRRLSRPLQLLDGSTIRLPMDRLYEGIVVTTDLVVGGQCVRRWVRWRAVRPLRGVGAGAPTPDDRFIRAKHDRVLTGLALFHTGLRFYPAAVPAPAPPRAGLTGRQRLALCAAPSPCPRRCIELIDHKEEGTP